MSQPVELVPMMCVQCKSPIPAKVDEVVWVCETCGQGMILNAEKGLTALEIHTAAGIPQNGTGRPFWVASGRVSLRRATFSGDNTRDMEAFWAQPRQFVIPAYQLGLEEITKMGVDLVRQPPALTPAASPVPFQPVVLMPGDVRPLAEFVILSIEAERRDALKELAFNLELESPQLWILPDVLTPAPQINPPGPSNFNIHFQQPKRP